MGENEEDLARIADYLIAAYGRVGAIKVIRRRLVILEDPKSARTARSWGTVLEQLEEMDRAAA